MKEKILGLQKNVFILGLTSLFNDFSSEMIFSVLPAFFISVLKTGAASLGLVDGIAEAASNFFKIYSGRLSDSTHSRKPLVILGYSLAVITRPFYIFAGTVGQVLGLRLTDRMGKGLRDSPRDAIISFSSELDQLGKSFGYHRTMDTIGAVLGPLVAYVILRNFPLHFNYVFITSFFVGLIALFTLIFISDVRGSTSKSNLGEMSRELKLFLFSIFILAVGTLPVAVILLKTTSIGLIVADIPLFYMVYSISYAVFSTPAGQLSDKIGYRKVVFIGYVLLLVSYFFLDKASEAITLLISFLVFGLFPALTDGVQRALASQLSSQNIRGSGLGWLNASNGFGALLAGIIGGYIWQVYNPQTAIIFASVVVCIGLTVFFISTRIKHV